MLERNRLAGCVLALLVFALTSRAGGQGIQKWQTPDGKLYFGDRPPPGSTLLGATDTLGTSGGGEVGAEEPAPHRGSLPRENVPPTGGSSDTPVDAGVSLAKRNRLYFDTWSQRGLSSNELEVIERNLNAVRNDVGRDLRVDPDARFQVILTEPDVFHRYSGTREHVTGLFDGKIHIPIATKVNEAELQGTLWHEYAHAVVRSKTGANCPVWLNEGIAVHQQSKIDPRRRESLRQLVRPDGKLPYSWAELDSMFHSQTASPEAQSVAYDQALAVVDYLYDRYGSRRVNDLLDRLGASADVEAALRETMHTSLDQLARQVVEHVKGG